MPVKTCKKSGLTLVEIMIVVMIVGIMATMALPAYAKVRRKTQVTVSTNLLRQFAQAADQYFLDYGTTEVNARDLIGASDRYMRLKQDVDKAIASLNNGGQIRQGTPIVISGISGGSVSLDF